jgi:hypothetical protein
MIDYYAIYEMWSIVTLWAIGLFVIFLLLGKVLPLRQRGKRFFRIFLLICMGYYIWWIADIFAVYSYGRASLPIRTFICLLVVEPADKETLLAEIPLVPGQMKYSVRIRHKYAGDYILGIKSPDSNDATRLNISEGESYCCSFSFVNSEGKAVFSNSFSTTGESRHEKLVMSYYVGEADDAVPARETLTLNVSFVGDSATFLRDNPGMCFFLSARGGL